MNFSWPVISIASRFTAVGIGLVQSIVIVKLLSVADYGLVGLVGAIGAIVGVYQNLGISSGSTREIAASKDRKDAFKVFIGSLLVRYGISLPLVIGLFVSAPYLGNVIYERPEIIFPIQIFALVLFIQALQSVLNSVVQGLKAFKFLFIFQVLISFVSLAVFIPFLIWFDFIGYFYAMLVFNLISTLILLAYSYRLFVGSIELPEKDELIGIVKAVFKIGLYVYVIKILFTQWQKIGPVILGTSVTDEMLGIFAFALLVASKIMTISDAITDVTLPAMTSAFEKSKEKFNEIFIKGNSKAYFLILTAAISVILLKREVFMVVDFIFGFMGRDPLLIRYDSAFSIMDPLIIAFWAYSHINLLQSGLSVPTKKMLGALTATIVMFALTVVSFYFINTEPVMAFAIAMAVGSISGYITYLIFLRNQMNFIPLTGIDIKFTLISGLTLFAYYLDINNIALAGIYFVIVYFIYAKIYRPKVKVA